MDKWIDLLKMFHRRNKRIELNFEKMLICKKINRLINIIQFIIIDNLEHFLSKILLSEKLQQYQVNTGDKFYIH